MFVYYIVADVRGNRKIRVENCRCIFSYFWKVVLDAMSVEAFPYSKSDLKEHLYNLNIEF